MYVYQDKSTCKLLISKISKMYIKCYFFTELVELTPHS